MRMWASLRIIKLKLDSSEGVRNKQLTVFFIFVVVKVVAIEDECALFERVGVQRLLLKFAFSFEEA